ncbi:DUF6300 family protein, partial [Streptomyces sp. NPDC051636]|uniref:DUF6300 family protein n=1 Tax=Streptomyces sp. NPDC051636 TaxID=3365663 RepID=UPI003790A154
MAPQDDEHGRPIHLELCPACDAGDVGRPVAGLLVQWFANGGGHDASRAAEGAHLLLEWTKECMAAHGWYWPGDAARPALSRMPRGAGAPAVP